MSNSDSGNLPRDPVTGVQAPREPTTKLISEMSSREIEEEIRRTRARMTSSLNEVESRISPAHLKQEMQESIQGAIEEVREHFHPRRMAKRAGDTMMDTIKENPIPALLAGASIGYLIVKATGENGAHAPYRDGGRRPAMSRSGLDRQYVEYGHGEGFTAEEMRGSSGYGRREDIAGRASQAAESARERVGESIESARERAGHTAERLREETSEALHSAQERTRRAAEMAQERAAYAGRRVREGAQSAESELVRFIHENPLVAGAVAIGIGALIGSLLPSTDMEDRMLGDKRDSLMGKAREAGDEARERARNVASAAKDELRESASRVADTARAEARELKESVAHSGRGSSEQDDQFGL